MKTFFKVLRFIALALLALVMLTFMVRYLHKSFGLPPQKEAYQDSPYYNFEEGKFINPIETPMMGFRDSGPVLKRFLTRKVEKQPSSAYLFREQELPANEADTLQINWLGHATVLLRSGSATILTDPVLLGRASPFSFVGPARFFPSPIAIDKLPLIDAVVISHDHYDHLSYETLVALHHKVGQFYVPLGVAETLIYWGIPAEKVTEITWWQTVETPKFTVTATPARHFSGRFLTQNNTFWNSYSIKLGGKKIYFGGDSGYFPGYTEIGQKAGPFDLTLMPIAAYDEAWANIHLNPEEAVQAHQDVRGNYLLPIHWGTFDLALHSWYEPMERLETAATSSRTKLLTPEPGCWLSLKSETDGRWWEEYRQQK